MFGNHSLSCLFSSPSVLNQRVVQIFMGKKLYNGVVKSIDFGDRMLEFRVLFHYKWVVQCWASGLISWWLSFLVCGSDSIVASTSEHFVQIKWDNNTCLEYCLMCREHSINVSHGSWDDFTRWPSSEWGCWQAFIIINSAANEYPCPLVTWSLWECICRENARE